MIITYIQLFFEFLKTGLFAIGGGLATLPFLYDIAEKYTWFDKSMLADMIAVSQSTPGPLGINMATYAGFNAAGILGAIIATFGLVLPSFVIIIIVAHFLKKFRESEEVNAVFYGLRPAVTGLIAIAGFEILKLSVITVDKFLKTKNILNIFDYKALILFIVLFVVSNKQKKHPALYLGIGAIVGIVFGL
ncbi:chromate transporter [[Clostridium] dakarense]|uniref:chromate transporter n=1 Tax=Faecalimicrobium dakarense TaxID=1301100 RepID=UPI0004BB21D7|nr:chromate transporter [[Clostridium] dakarense]